jgi:hypothetical protein
MSLEVKRNEVVGVLWSQFVEALLSCGCDRWRAVEDKVIYKKCVTVSLVALLQNAADADDDYLTRQPAVTGSVLSFPIDQSDDVSGRE